MADDGKRGDSSILGGIYESICHVSVRWEARDGSTNDVEQG